MSSFSGSRREWAIAIAGGLGLAALLSWLLGSDLPSAAPPAPAPTPAPVSPAAVPSAAPAAPPAAPAPAIPDLVLHGVIQRDDGAAAIIGTGDGRQRLVRVGREVAPGLTLLRIAGHRAVLGGAGGGEVVLGFAEAPRPEASPAAQQNVAAWRLALEPVRAGGTLRGWRLVDVARVPLLAAAGLRTGDILVDLGGNALSSEEKILELPGEIAANPGAELGIERDGRQQRIKLPG